MKKLIVCSLFLIMGFFINLIHCNAEVNIDSVLSKFQDNINSLSGKLGEESNITVEKSGDNIKVKQGEEQLISYSLVDGVISNEMDVNAEDFESGMASVLNILINEQLLVALAEEKGISERDIRLFASSKDYILDENFEDDGYQMYVKEESDTQGKLIFKLDIEKFTMNINYFDVEAPTLRLTKEDNNTIGVEAFIDLENAREVLGLQSSDEVMVEIYRSTDNENFEYIFSISASDINSENSFSMSDTIEENKTYYYKGVVEFSNNYSKIYEINEKVNNPETTLSLSIINKGILLNIDTNLSDNEQIKIYRSEDNTNFTYLTSVTVLNNQASYIDSSIESGKTYYYKIECNGMEEGLISNIKYVKSNDVENPDTGIKNHALLGITFVLIGLLCYKLINKKLV